jgi:hypothetical protein
VVGEVVALSLACADLACADVDLVAAGEVVALSLACAGEVVALILACEDDVNLVAAEEVIAPNLDLVADVGTAAGAGQTLDVVIDFVVHRAYELGLAVVAG